MRWPGRKDPESGRRLPFEITPLAPDQQAPPAPADDQPPPPAAPPPAAPPAREPAPAARGPAPSRSWTRQVSPRRDRIPLVATPVPTVPPPAARPEPPNLESARPDLPDVLVRFGADAVPAALAFAGATAGGTMAGGIMAGRTATAAGPGQRRVPGSRCRVSRRDGSVWIGLDDQAAAGSAAELAAALGGTVVRHRDGWPHGPSPGAPALDDAGLEPVPLLWLASTLMPAGRLRPSTEIAVVTTGRLAGPVLRRWQRSPAEVTISELSLEPIAPGAPPAAPGLWPAVLIRVTSRNGRLPQQAIAALTDLPHTVVCRVTDRMLIDIRFMLPAGDRQLAAEIPAGESWIAGGAEVGLWRIVSRGAEVVPPARLALAVSSGAVPPHLGSPGAGLPRLATAPSLAPGAPVQVVPARRPDGRADAMLLDDLELERLRRFLSMSPLAETAFIFPGLGRHLLTEPAGLLTTVPFGVPVRRIGPGGLYLEAGHELDPPVPFTARQELFGLNRDSIVVLGRDGAWRLALSDMVPAWRLWLGRAPVPAGGISERGRQLLTALAPAAPVPAAPSGPARDQGRTGQLDRGQLLIEAEQLEQRGELAGAARRLEEVGELYRAAVLYQRAAREAAGHG